MVSGSRFSGVYFLTNKYMPKHALPYRNILEYHIFIVNSIYDKTIVERYFYKIFNSEKALYYMSLGICFH